MSKEIIYSAGAPEPIGPYSQAVKAGNMYFVSGQIALDRESGAMLNASIETETKQVMKNIESILKVAGLGFGDIVKTSIFLKSMNDFPKVNEIYGSFFKTQPPARETVEVSRLPKDAIVEISCIAVK
jgi:2-iminobutanoate/2-iminopropanoate deaminase